LVPQRRVRSLSDWNGGLVNGVAFVAGAAYVSVMPSPDPDRTFAQLKAAYERIVSEHDALIDRLRRAIEAARSPHGGTRRASQDPPTRRRKLPYSLTRLLRGGFPPRR